MINRGALVCLAVLAAAPTAKAEWSTGDMLQNYEAADATERAQISLALSHTLNGAQWASTFYNERNNQKLLFCIPGGYLSEAPKEAGRQLLIVLQAFASTRPEVLRFPYPMVLIIALQKTFPCKGGATLGFVIALSRRRGKPR